MSKECAKRHASLLSTIKMHKKDHTKTVVWIIILVSLAIRIFALFFIDSISNPQVWEYEEAANNFLDGKGLYYNFIDTECRNTGIAFYSFICAVIYYFTQHSFLAVKIFQIIISVFGCFLIYRLCRRLFGKKVGLIALALTATHPGLITYSVKLHSLSLDILLFALAAHFFLSVFEGKKIFKNSLLTGIFVGMTFLTRATIGLFMPIGLLILILKMKNAKKTIIKSTLGILIGIFLILSPLIVRNYLIFHKFVIAPNDSGINFWTGNNPNSIGTSKTLDGRSVFLSAPRDLLKRIKGVDEFQKNAVFYDEGWGFIKDNPRKAMTLFAKKLYYFWWFSPTQGLEYPRAWFYSYQVYYSLLILFAGLSIFMGLRGVLSSERQMQYIVLLFCAAISVAQALYYAEGRHRWGIEPFILMFSANGLSLAWGLIKNGYKRS